MEVTPGGATWSAKVWRGDGVLVGTPSGVVYDRQVAGIGFLPFIEGLVVAAIEQRAGVD